MESNNEKSSNEDDFEIRIANSNPILRFNELDRRGLNEKSKDINCSLAGWGRTLKNALLMMTFYFLGVATSILILNWMQMDTLCREHPFIFWLASLSISLIGIYISLKKRS